jgi:hypothetical protein
MQHLAVSIPADESLTTYPPHPGAALSSLFTVSAQQSGGTVASPPVFSSSSGLRCSQYPAASPDWCPDDSTQAWASLWFAGAPVTVTVSTTLPGGWGFWSQVEVLPRSANVTLRHINASGLSFAVPPSRLGWKLSVESAPQRAPARAGYPPVVKHSLMIFADPAAIAPDPGKPADSTSRLYFGPGLHKLRGQMVVPERVTSIYVAGGAWVSGG